MEIETFSNPKNIIYGQARVIYDYHGYTRQAGWHLPGDRFTTDYGEAHRVAVAMDKLMRESA